MFTGNSFRRILPRGFPCGQDSAEYIEDKAEKCRHTESFPVKISENEGPPFYKLPCSGIFHWKECSDIEFAEQEAEEHSCNGTGYCHHEILDEELPRMSRRVAPRARRTPISLRRDDADGSWSYC